MYFYNNIILYNNLYKSFKRIIKNAEITQYATLHTLRHTFGSQLLYKGADIPTISSLMGHSKPSITEDVYLHVSQSIAAKEIETLEI